MGDSRVIGVGEQKSGYYRAPYRFQEVMISPRPTIPRPIAGT